MSDILQSIQQQVENNPILIYMKGSPEQPQCGFSSQSSQMLMACGKPFAYIDILSNPEIRANLPKFSDWPTFPQLFVQGELVGGCDIITEMYQSGELQTLLDDVPLPDAGLIRPRRPRWAFVVRRHVIGRRPAIDDVAKNLGRALAIVDR